MPGNGAERLSVIVPTLNEAERIEPLLSGLSALRRQGHEVIVVDGGSSDDTAQLAEGKADHVMTVPRGRARQMNAGADQTQGGVLLFLHADTVLPEDAARLILSGLAETGRAWGRFDVVIDGRHPLLPVIAWFMNRRSRLTGIATGDQAIFVRRALFQSLGGFPEQPLMEDIELCKRLLRTGPPLCLPQRVVTSGRRWETRGVWRTMMLMWRLRWLYWRGVPAERLAGMYR